MINKKIRLISLLCSALIGCEQQKNNVMTVDEAYNYKISTDNQCDSFAPWQGQYCDQAVGLYNDANMKVQDKVLQDAIIQRLLTKAQDIDCYHTYPEPAVCVAVDIRANEIEMNFIRELGLSAKTPIFDVSSAHIQDKFNQRLNDKKTNLDATKLLREASESKNI